MGIGSQAVFCCTFSFTPNQITGSVWQQPRDWGSLLNFSESGRGRGGGAQLLLISFGTRLHGICNGSNNGMEDGSGGHTIQPHNLGTGDKCPTPNFRALFGTERGHSSVLSSRVIDIRYPSGPLCPALLSVLRYWNWNLTVKSALCRNETVFFLLSINRT